MLKKVTAIILALFIINVSLFAQLSEEAEVIVTGESDSVFEELIDTRITQHIKWREVSRAHQYEIEVQQKTADGWIESGIWTTEETEYDLLLEAGSYRFRIAALNIIGKKGNPSEWAEFDVIDEAQPYLRAVAKSNTYGVAAIERSIDDENGKETIEIRGVHCFDNGSSFVLEPCSDEARVAAFRPFDKQKTVQLPVVESDKSRGVIKLSFDWSKIVSGYYNLVVTNSAGLSDALTVLMLPDKKPVLVCTDAVHDDVMQAEFVDAASGLTKLAFSASSLQQDSEYKIIPVENAENQYPFETSFGRIGQSVTMNSYDDGRLSLDVNSSLLKSGWYDVVAETPGADAGSQRIFIQTADTSAAIPEVKSISGKYNADRRSITFTVKLEEAFFTEDNSNQLKAFLISERNEYGEFNKNILRQASVSKNGKTAEFEIMSSSVRRGTNALMLETLDGMRLTFLNVSSGYTVEEKTLSEQEIRECFLRAPTEEELAALDQQKAQRAAEGIMQAEYLPAFQNPNGKWYFPDSPSFPGTMNGDESGLSFSVVNIVEKTPYESRYHLKDEETLDMLRAAEGISFQSMITRRNNGWTNWYLDIDTTEGNVTITIPHTYRQLTQTVVIWKDYQINPETIRELTFRVNAKYPEAAGWENALEVYEAMTYSGLEPAEELTYKVPHFFTKAGVLGAYALEPKEPDTTETGLVTMTDDRVDDIVFPSYIYLNVFDTDWLSVNASYIPEGMGTNAMIGGEVTLSIPNDWFEPYVGMGILFGEDSRWEPLFVGVVLCKYVNIRFVQLYKGMTLSGAGLASSDASNANNVVWWGRKWLEFGIEVPFRQKKVQFVSAKSAEEKKTPAFFTDLLINADVYSEEAFDEDEYLKTLPDFSFGCRIVNLKYMALDVTAGTHNLMLGDELSLGSYDFSGGLKFMLPLFKAAFTPYIGLDYGYLLHQDDDEDSMYFSPTAGIKFGKYVSLSVNGKLYDSDWDDTWDLVDDAPVLAPITCVMSCTDWRFNLEISIPLRDK